MRNLTILVSLLTIISCNKKDDITQTFTGNLPIVKTSTQTTTTAGQDIITNIRCELTSLSGDVSFQGFDIQNTSEKEYSISAKALYKDWNTQIGMPVMWTLDTTASIRTTTAGKYILNFYNSNKLFKSDTVHVN
jgi:hypothetical protein